MRMRPGSPLLDCLGSLVQSIGTQWLLPCALLAGFTAKYARQQYRHATLLRPSGTNRRPGVGVWGVSHCSASLESARACPEGARLHVGAVLAAGARACAHVRVWAWRCRRRPTGALGWVFGVFLTARPHQKARPPALEVPGCTCGPVLAAGARVAARKPAHGRIAARAGYGQKLTARD